MKSYNLQYYVDKLKKGEKFSLARYGDGEFYCMWGKQGENSNGCLYSPELREALIKSLRHKDDLSFIYGMQRVLPQDQAKAEKEYPGIDWHDSEVFGEAVARGELFPFIEQLRNMKLVVIGNESIFQFIYKTLKPQVFIKVPPVNAFTADVKIPIIKDAVYLFSCGMAANAFIAEFHGKVDGWLIDLGHIWDPFTGNMSRCDLEGKTLEEINRNLVP